MGPWIGCNWLGTGRGGGCFEYGNENSNFRKMKISWLLEKLRDSEELLCFMELVGLLVVTNM